MRHFLFFILFTSMFIGCSKNFKILDSIKASKEGYALYIVKDYISLPDTSHNLTATISAPILIDDIETLNRMKKEWILKESEVPDSMDVAYRGLLYENGIHKFTFWLDEKLETLIWDEYLLSFNDSLLLSHEKSFKYLPEYHLGITKASNALILKDQIINAGGLVSDIRYKNEWPKFDGKYKLKRLKNDLKPIRNVGKIRKEIIKDFSNKQFYLIDYIFDTDSDSMTVFISSDSAYVKEIPSSYSVVGTFEYYDSIKFTSIGLEKSKLLEIASNCKTELFMLQ